MRFLESWTVLPLFDLVRMVLPAACLVVVVALPGRVVARWGAVATALSIFAAPELLPYPAIHATWTAMWLGIAWLAGRSARAPRARRRLGLLEQGVVSLLLGLSLGALLFATIARQNLPHDETRRTTLGIVVLVLGLLHLMMRRHSVRAAVGLAAMGFGLQVIELTAWESLGVHSASPSLAIGVGTAIAVGLAARIGRTRERVATSPWVGDAHDLHD